jgi:hypothetical protein
MRPSVEGQTLSTPGRERQSRPARLVALLLVPLAIAVAGALLLLRLYFQPPTVPRYILAGSGSDAAEAALLRGARFELTLQPVEPVVGAVGARAFLLRGSEVRPWEPPFEVGRDGSVRIEGRVDTLFANVPPGDWELAIAVGRPETLPTAPRDILRARGGSSDAGPAPWQLVLQQIKVGR